jgi:GTP-binding protein
MAGDYLEQRPQLRHVFVLIDSRHPPQRIDLDFTTWLGATAVPFSLVFTKSDKQSLTKTRNNIDLFLGALTSRIDGVPQVHITSAKTGEGRDSILRSIILPD